MGFQMIIFALSISLSLGEASTSEEAFSPADEPAYIKANQKQNEAGNALNEKRYEDAMRLYIESLESLEDLPPSASSDVNVRLMSSSSINGIFGTHKKICKTRNSELCTTLGLLYLYLVVERNSLLAGDYSKKDAEAATAAAKKLVQPEQSDFPPTKDEQGETLGDVSDPKQEGTATRSPSDEVSKPDVTTHGGSSREVPSDDKGLIERFSLTLDVGQGWGNYWLDAIYSGFDHHGLYLGFSFGYRSRRLGDSMRHRYGVGFQLTYSKASLNRALLQNYPNAGVRVFAPLGYIRYSASLLKKPRALALAVTGLAGYSNHKPLYSETLVAEENFANPMDLHRQLLRFGIGIDLCLFNESFCFGGLVVGESNFDDNLASIYIGWKTDLLRLIELTR